MFTYDFRAFATALVIGTAAVGAVGALAVTAAHAAEVSAAVGKPLLEAQSLANAGNYSAANARLREAESAAKNSDERNAVSQMKAFVASKSGDYSSLGGAAGAKAKFAADYNARRYADVIADEDLLRKANALDSNSQQVIAQAYYNLKNYAGCTRYLRQAFGNGGSEAVLGLKRSCAHAAGDQRAEQEALEQLVARTGDAKYWSPLLTQSLRLRGLSDEQTLDLYRLKYLTGSISRPDEYMTLAQLAIVAGLPKEAQKVVAKGMEAKALTGDRPQRLANMAAGRAKAADAAFAKNMAAANAAPNGDALVKLGVAQNSAGNSADAIKTIQAGIAKGVTDKGYAQVRLGLAYLDAKQKEQALRAFNSVRGDSNWTHIARLWSLYARS